MDAPALSSVRRRKPLHKPLGKNHRGAALLYVEDATQLRLFVAAERRALRVIYECFREDDGQDFVCHQDQELEGSRARPREARVTPSCRRAREGLRGSRACIGTERFHRGELHPRIVVSQGEKDPCLSFAALNGAERRYRFDPPPNSEITCMPIRIHEPIVLADEADQSAHIAASGKPFGLRSPPESSLAHAHVPLKALMMAGFAPIVRRLRGLPRCLTFGLLEITSFIQRPIDLYAPQDFDT